MERVSKKFQKRVSILNLGDHINEKNIIKKILMNLNNVDWELVWAAHNKKIEDRLVRNTDFLLDCVGEGYLDVLVWLRANGCEWNMGAYARAARKGHVHILKYLKQQKLKWDWSIGYEATIEGHLEVLMWLKENHYPHNSQYICRDLAKRGHLNALKWAMKNGYTYDTTDCNVVAMLGNLESLKCMIENGCPYDYNQLYNIVKHWPEIIEWLNKK